MENHLQQANDFRKQGKFEEAIHYYEKAYNDPQTVLNKWDIWGYVHSLKKTGNLDKSIELSEKHISEYSDFENLANNLTWAYFDKYIRNFQPSEISNIEKALDRIYEINGQQAITEQTQIPCPFTIGVFKVLKHYKRPNFNTHKIRYWIDKIDPDKLSQKEQVIDLKGKETKLASDYENYYSLLITLLFNEAKYPECIETVEHALKCINQLHYDNSIWFKRRIALCHVELGSPEKAEEILQSLVKGKGEKWFMEYELSKIYFEQENLEKSLDFAVKAAKNFGDDLMKVNLYTHLARILYKQEKLEYAKSHAELVIAIKQANDSKLDAEQQKLASFFKLNTEETIDLRNQKRSVEKIWNEIIYGSQEKLKGTISKILPNGKSGFIKADNGKDSYFFRFNSVKARKEFIQEGKKVNFLITESFDKSKNQKSVEAVEIFLIR
jgi:tetratricopeptide (TPR) repeat protein/cold shock CspA family protein